MEVSVVDSVAGIDPATWDALANPVAEARNPTLSHAFFMALEQSGSIAPESGWLPQHMIAKDDSGVIRAILPLYLKSHSFGEYVFDQGWADAYQRHGLRYYPKLLSAVPVTPVPGRRFLAADPDRDRVHIDALAKAVTELVRRQKLSSAHITFLSESEASDLSSQGWLLRTGQQYHWTNEGYATFDDFLGSLSSRKRKTLKRERRDALAGGFEIRWLTGRDITESDWDTFFDFYMDTGNRKWGAPYLNRAFFGRLGQSMSEDVLLVMCRRNGRTIAGALNLIGGATLYGRYWGCIEQQPFLHFEVCYYQAIDYAISRGLERVEAGAGGEHKLVRGYLPAKTLSAHWIADSRFRRAIDDYLSRERRHVEAEAAALAEYAPFKRDPSSQNQ